MAEVPSSDSARITGCSTSSSCNGLVRAMRVAGGLPVAQTEVSVLQRATEPSCQVSAHRGHVDGSHIVDKVDEESGRQRPEALLRTDRGIAPRTAGAVTRRAVAKRRRRGLLRLDGSCWLWLVRAGMGGWRGVGRGV